VQTKDFAPFWEFVAGPLNAGSFGPNTTDSTFGPQVLFAKAPPTGQANLSPFAGLQFFGEVNIDKKKPGSDSRTEGHQRCNRVQQNPAGRGGSNPG
jgi:phosphodiesterase/alkaline phosphatase D-like protein